MSARDDSTPDAYFDGMYGRGPDPWHYADRHYERRKREILLATLPRARFASAFEPACATGELTVALADRCDRVLASDLHEAPLTAARKRLASYANVEIRSARMPEDWPNGRFSLVVLSEFGYYLGETRLNRLADRTCAALAEDAAIVACHWRHRVPEHRQSGDAVHAALHAAIHDRHGLAHIARHEEPDFLIDLWTTDPRSPAAREGLR